MKTRLTPFLTALAAVALALFGAGQAMAGGTPSGTPISNTAVLNYVVNSIPQDEVDSNEVTFLVDKKVDVTVERQDVSIVQVTPGALTQVLTFTVTNTGNDSQDIALAAIAQADGLGITFGETTYTDNFNFASVSVFVESGEELGYQEDQDTATFIKELAPNTSVTVYIVANIPLDRANNDVAIYALRAQVRAVGAPGVLGAELTATHPDNVADDVVDILFADAAGTDDGPNTAMHSARSAFQVITATMDVTKEQSFSHPTLGNGFAIPGATVTYTITIANDGSAPATGLVLVDSIPDNTTYASFPTCGTAGDKEWSTDNAVSWVDTEPGDLATITHIRCSIDSIAAAASATVEFTVTID